MKIIKQIGIIFSVCWISMVIEKIFPGVFPASIIGMILLFLCLAAGILKIEHVQEKSDFLLENMAFFFIPAGVSIINYMDILKNAVVQLIIICTVSTVVTFAVTAYTVRFTMYLIRKKKSDA
ncbi:CidA/LrgA family protein [Mediterraneibacter glycyrrhizinilyticus]|uniref:CidA/LrgA family protein n=1 Tax=Mediterraneibacter glycyrrhizinilyticus TaxID=342942 RepID=UPI0019616B50|nr:CidA/LrgA family protein [Mediterraneibacter glycyrrhizinilyticus]MBM6751842.1 CidA/LrgA family protein [Mediterraneibacter glycyrrhizinilyticus]HJC90040.1 CidA/LrgA family protein [Candidatus Mediterraneibacter excrementigallinarum]